MIKKLKSILMKDAEKDFSFLLKKSFLALTIRFSSFIASYLLTFSIARLYGASVVGTYALAYTLLQIMAILSLFGLDNLIVRSLASAPDENKFSIIKSTYIHSLIIVVSFALIISVLSYVLSDFISTEVFHKPQFASHFRISCLALIPFVSVLLHAACFRGMKNMTGFSIFRLLIPLFTALLIIFFFYANKKISPVQSLMISVIFLCAISFIAWFRFARLSGVHYEIKNKSLKILYQSYPMLITGSVFFILGWVDNICIGIFKTERDLGIYDIAFKIAAASAIVLAAFNAIQAPVFAELYAKSEKKKLRSIVQSSTRIMFYITFPLTLLVCLFPEVILGIFGDEFKEASLSLIILSIGSFINVSSGSVGILLQMTGRQRQYNNIVLIGAGINIGLNILLIPRMGILGAAIASATSKIFQNIAAVMYVKKVFGFTTLYLPLFFKNNKS